MGVFSGPRSGAGGSTAAEPATILPPEERKAVMQTMGPLEVKWTLDAFILATVAGIAIPAYIIATNKVTRQGKNTIAVAPDAKLLGGAILLLCVIGFLALWKRKRTLVAFDLFLVGFAFTLFIGLIGFGFILLGGWLMLRAWRINKYGTTSARAIAQEARTRPRGRDRKAAASTGKKTTSPSAPAIHRPRASATRRKRRRGRRSPSRPNNIDGPAARRGGHLERRARVGEAEGDPAFRAQSRAPTARAGARPLGGAPESERSAPRPAPVAPRPQ